MKTTLVGYTGFVGGNLAASHSFDFCYNSKNIAEAFGEQHDLVVYCGVRAEKFLANQDPDGDRAVIENAKRNIERMKPQTLVLVSTVDVYKTPLNVDETTPIELEGLHPYGANRYELERWAQQNAKNCHIVRLPALVGRGLKKNAVFDMINRIPSMLKAEKYAELHEKSPLIAASYALDEATGFYKLRSLDNAQRTALRAFFEHNDFSALSFTNGASSFQFYDLACLWEDIQRLLAGEVRLLNIVSEPVTVAEIYRAAFGGEYPQTGASVVRYDIETAHAGLFDRPAGRYGYGKEEILARIKQGVSSGAFSSR